MATVIRPELSEKNKHRVEKHRYYELKHFCMQYPMWKKMYAALDGFSKKPTEQVVVQTSESISDPTYKCVEAKLYYYDRIKLLEKVANDTDAALSSYILKAVTEEISYEHLKARLDIPCSRDTYYKLYRRFFWLLNDARK